MDEFQIFISEQEVDLYDPLDLDLAITLAIAEANNLQVSKTANTKTIKVPATGNNKRIFGHPENINSVVNIDQSVKPPVKITRGGTQIFIGYVKINGTLDNDKEKILDYELNCIGDNGDWLAKMLNKNLNELDYSDQNHINSKLVVQTSETVVAGREYVYDLIDRGKFHGYDYGTPAKDSVSIMDRFPAISMRSFVDRCYAETGYRVVSNFLDSAFFRALYWPFSNKALIHPPTFNNDVVGEMYMGADEYNSLFIPGPFTSPGISSFRAKFTSPHTILYDTAGCFDHAHDGYYFCKGTGKYRMEFRASFTVYTDPNPSGIGPEATATFTFYKVNFYKDNGVPYALSQSYTLELTSSATPENYTVEFQRWMDLEFGDEIYVNVDLLHYDNGTSKYFKFNAGGTWIKVKEVQGQLGMGEYQMVEMNYNLPDCPRINFIQGLKDCFNLMFFTDINSRTVYIETWEDFYAEDAETWTHLLDKDQDIRIKFTGSDLSKIMRYKYKADSNDKVVQAWEKENLRDFGSEDSELTNVYSKDKIQEIENRVFSPTWMQPCERIGLSSDAIPLMWSDVTLPPHSTKFAPRILYYDGIKPVTSGDSWRMNEFGFYDHQVYNVIADKRTTFPSFYSYSNAALNDNNLMYHDTFYSSGLHQKYFRNREKTMDDGRQYYAYINLTDVLVSKLSFRSHKYIEDPIGNGAFFILDKVDRYRPQDKESTLCLLTKVVSRKKIRSLPYFDISFPVPDTFPAMLGGVGSDPTGRSLMIGGRTVMRMSTEGELMAGGGPVYVEIDGILYPVYYNDEAGDWMEVKKD